MVWIDIMKTGYGFEIAASPTKTVDSEIKQPTMWEKNGFRVYIHSSNIRNIRRKVLAAIAN